MTTLKPIATRAQIHRLCCDSSLSGKTRGETSKARWELYIVVYNTTEMWPRHHWPVSRRHHLPTIAERTEALAHLGYAPAPGAEWEWQETDTPDYHGHPSEPSFLGTISIVPLEQAQAAEDGAE
ncbi:DUF6303 family protein [Streptomyces griseoincarnatus]